MVGLDERAKILSEALPYILKYKDTIIVIKYGETQWLMKI